MAVDGTFFGGSLLEHWKDWFTQLVLLSRPLEMDSILYMHSWLNTLTMLYGQQQKLFYGVLAGSPKYFFETNRKTHKQINKKSYLD